MTCNELSTYRSVSSSNSLSHFLGQSSCASRGWLTPRFDLQEDFGMGGWRVSVLRLARIYSSIEYFRDEKSSERCELIELLIYKCVVVS